MAYYSESEDKRARAYEVLGLPDTSTEAEIRKRFRELALRYHPDKNPDNPEAQQEFIRIKEAYEVLIGKEQNDEYASLEELLAMLVELERNLGELNDLANAAAQEEPAPWWFKICVVLTCCCCCMCCCECCGACSKMFEENSGLGHFNFSKDREREPILRQPTSVQS